MDCEECKSRLVEAAEGGPADEGGPAAEAESALRLHLASCESCRAEFEVMKRGADVLRETIPSLAPHQAYLTRARMERLMDAHAGGVKIFRLFSYRQFVTAAAAAAILISIGFITANLGRMHEDPPPETIAQVATPSDYVPVVLASTGGGDSGSALGRMSVIHKARTPWVERPGGERPVGMDSPGVIVPVQHAFYDPAESPYWW